ARAELPNVDPSLAPLIERSIAFGLSTAEAAMKAAADAEISEAAKEATDNAEREGRLLRVEVKKDGRIVGNANATLNLDRTLRTVLTFARRDQGELPFAIDRRGKLYTPNAADMPRLESLAVAELAPGAADGQP